MASVKLPRLPDRKPMKMVIAVLPDLHDSLTAYAAAYAQKYGVEEPVTDLIPAMLSAFLESDRAFARTKR